MPTRTLSRRDFLKVTGLTLGTGVAACSGLTALATHSPTITLMESAYGDLNLSRRILVAYASKCGSTGEVAQVLGKTLAQCGAHILVLPLEKVTSLAEYQAVLVGSAIRMGRWLPEASDFVSKNRAILQGIPTAYFTVCATLIEDTADNRSKAAGFLEAVRKTLAPVAEGYFAGKVDPSKLSFLESTMLKAKHVPQGDFRDWDQITSWAQNTYARLCS